MVISLCLHPVPGSPAVTEEENDIPLSWLPSEQESGETEHLRISWP